MNRKDFLLSDIYLIKYGNYKSVVMCPNCKKERSVSTGDYYKKRQHGQLLCRQCNKPVKRKESLHQDPQVIECPKTFKKSAAIFIKVKCLCEKIIEINATAYWKIKKRDGIWTCQDCRKSKHNRPKIYDDPEYRDQFIKMHQDQEYAKKVHSVEINKKISASSIKAWQDSEKKESHLAHRQTKEFKTKISKWAKRQWEKKSKEIIDKNAQNFIIKANEKHDEKYSYDINEYTSLTEPITITCNSCDHRFIRIPLSHYRSCKCPKCGLTQGQQEIYDFVSTMANATINNRSILNGQEIDVYVPERNFGIEYHGLYWHSYDKLETTSQRLRHQQKAILALNNGINLIQIFEHEWNTKQSIVKSMITHKLKLSQKLNARSLKLQEVPNNIANKFFMDNHLLGIREAKWTIGLYDDQELIIALSCNPKHDGMEIMRLATKIGFIVRGGISKLLQKMIKDHIPKTIYTFSDFRYTDGGGYESVGFLSIGLTKPNYWYYKGNKILSRQQCQKHKLSRLLGENFDESLSEANNMFANGYRRFWDAGHMKYKYNLAEINNEAQ